MTTVVDFFHGLPFLAVHDVEIPGPNAWLANSVFSVERLPTEPIATTTVTFAGVTAGMEIHVYLPDGPDGSAGTELTGVESCVANQVLTWNVYAVDNPYNNVIITIIKRGYKPRKFIYPSKPGEQTLPLFFENDRGYNNPA